MSDAAKNGIDAWLEEGLRHYSQGDPSRALEAWHKILDVEPAHSLAQQYVAYVRQVYRLDAPAPPAAEPPSTGQIATGGHQATATLDRAFMANPAVPAAESFGAAPGSGDGGAKKSVVGLDSSSSWSDVVDSAFDVSVNAAQPKPAEKEAPKPAAKMSSRDPWASPKTGSAGLAIAGRTVDTPDEPASERATTDVQRFRALEPQQPPPVIEPMSTSLPPTAPQPRDEMESLRRATEPSAPSEPPAPPPFPAPAVERVLAPPAPPDGPASSDSGFDPWRGDTMPPVQAGWAPNVNVAIDVPPPTPPPLSQSELQAFARAAAAEPLVDVDVDVDMSDPPAPLPRTMTPSIEVDLSTDFLAAPRSDTPPPASAPTPSWKQNSKDELPADAPPAKTAPGFRAPEPSAAPIGVHRTARSDASARSGAGRVDVVPEPRAATPSPAPAPSAAKGGPLEERPAATSRRFDQFDTPRAPTPAPSPPPAPVDDEAAFAVPSGELAFAMPAPSASPFSRAPAPTAAPFNLTPSAPVPSPAAPVEDDPAPGVVVDPWDEVAGPGALDLDKQGSPSSRFDALLGQSASAKVEQWPSPAPEEPPEDQCTALMRGAKELFDLGDFSGSLDLVEKVIKLDPENEGARSYMKRNEATLVRMYESKLGDMRRSPKQLMPPDEVIWMNMHHKAGFILSQVDGMLSFEDILEVSGMPRFDTMRILNELVSQGIIG